jgi:tetratricopeptide (TPR) repeat protein
MQRCLDAQGLPLTIGDRDVAMQFDRTVSAYLGSRADTRSHLAELLSSDPHCVLGHCLDGYLFMLSSRRAGITAAAGALARAQEAAARGITSGRDLLHIEALTAWASGDMRRAADVWESLLRVYPRDLMALKVSHFVLSYLGESTRMREVSERSLRAWDPAMPGFGFALGCHAYTLEECGQYELADEAGRRAVLLNPKDIWAAHAVAHVHEMQGDLHTGIQWIASLSREWEGCSNFALHLRWHEALYELELGAYDRVLALYDREVRASSTDEYLDITNAVSLLWRLEQAGVDVGPRWIELADRAKVLGEDHVLVFVDAHYLMALAATGDEGAVASFLESCESFAAHSTGTEAGVMRDVGLPLLRAILAHRRGSYGEVCDLLLPLLHRIRDIGGSHAQRDVFEQLLIDAAWRARRLEAAEQLLAARTASRPRNLWGWKHRALVLDAAGASSARDVHRTAEQLAAAQRV